MTTTNQSTANPTRAAGDIEPGDYRSKPEAQWTASDRSEAYLDSRPVGGPYDPAAEYGDPHWREPESDDEATARTAHLDAAPRDPETAAWVERVAAISKDEDALVQAGIDLWHAEATHDPDEVADAHAEYQAARVALESGEHHDTEQEQPEHIQREHSQSEHDPIAELIDAELTEPEHDTDREYDDEEAEL